MRDRRSPLYLMIAVVMLAAHATTATAQTVFETLVMPGPLVRGHANLETTCEKCHEPLARLAQSKLCLDCHKDVAADRTAKQRFHGREPSALSRECKHCHTEHKGRDAAIAQLDRQTFKHDLAAFRLTGAHASGQCEGCHKPKAKYRSAPNTCVDCHKAIEPHKGRLGPDCQNCHTDKSWLPARAFDHDKTRFPLVSSHKPAPCASCHAGEKYRGVGTYCVSCHTLQDKHNGTRGDRCEGCHTPTKWAQSSFNHDRSTKFPLRGKHANARCETCHGDRRAKPETSCVGCHRADDRHQAQLGTRCETCHNETGWRRKTAFDHDLTKFPLIGLHAAVPCESCHRTVQFKDAATQCAACHKDSRHEGRLTSNCARCHNPNGWDRWRFDHARETRFALTGGHQNAHCHSCHTAKSASKVVASSICNSCHAADDAHRGSFGTNCVQCHTTSTFRQSRLRR